MTGGRPGDGTVAGLRSCRAVFVRADDQTLTLLLDASGHDVPVTIPLPERAAQTLDHLAILHGHSQGCGAAPDVHVGLLVRSLRAAGAWPLLLVVRPAPAPAFWLRVMTTDGPVDVDVGVLDAAALIMSRRLPLALVDTGADPWERTIAQLQQPRQHP